MASTGTKIKHASQVPVVDFQPFASDGGKVLLGAELVKHLEDFGFLYVVNHGLNEQLLQRGFQLAKEFFSLPLDTKEQYLRPKGVHDDLGYIPFGYEKLVNYTRPEVGKTEIRESFNFLPYEKNSVKEVADFYQDSNKLFDALHKLSLDVMDCLALGLGLDETKKDVFRESHRLVGTKQNTTKLRYLWYPPVQGTKEEMENHTRLGTHTDYGSITLLFQDDTGGLEVQNVYGDFVKVPPMKGPNNTSAMLIQVGDLLERQTSNRLLSTKHRVLLTDASQNSKTRQSLALFLHADSDYVATCLDGSNKYPDVLVGDYIRSRFAITY